AEGREAWGWDSLEADPLGDIEIDVDPSHFADEESDDAEDALDEEDEPDTSDDEISDDGESSELEAGDEVAPPDDLDEEVASPPEAWELPDEMADSQPPADPRPPGEPSSTTTQQILEEFEEAGLYFEQRLFDA